MSRKPRLGPGGAPIVNLPHATPPAASTSHPMSPQEAHQIGTLQAQQAALNAAFDALGAQACARLGLAVGTKLHADPRRGVYTVG